MLNASAWIADQGPGYEMVWGYAGGARKLNFLHTFLRAISSSSAQTGSARPWCKRVQPRQRGLRGSAPSPAELGVTEGGTPGPFGCTPRSLVVLFAARSGPSTGRRGAALNAHAAAPMQELAEQSQAGPTTMLRHEIIMLARDLHNEDTTVSRNAALRVKDLVLASNPEQRQNQKLIANVDGLIDGLINLLRRGSLAGKYYSCHALAQLAWSNPSNSLLIPSV